MPKEGQHVVRVRPFHSTPERFEHKINAIFQCTRDSEFYAYYTGFSAVSEYEWRYASAQEIAAYNLGCRNVDDISEYMFLSDDINYDIY